MHRQSILKLARIFFLVLAFGSAPVVEGAQVQSSPVRHAQPDGGAITLAGDWVVASAAEDAAKNLDGLIVQELMNARARRNGLPVVLRSWRLSSSKAAELLVQDTIDSLGGNGVVVRRLTPPHFSPPQGMRTTSKLLGYDMGVEFRSMFVTSSTNAVSHVIGVTWPAAIDQDFAQELKQILENWVPSTRISTLVGMARPEVISQTLTLPTGETLTTPAGWQVVSTVTASRQLPIGQKLITAEQLISLRRSLGGPTATEILLLIRLRGAPVALADAERFLKLEIEATGSHLGETLTVESRFNSPNSVELSSTKLSSGLSARARVEQRGPSTFAALCFASDSDDAAAAVSSLLASLRSVTPAPPLQPSPSQRQQQELNRSNSISAYEDYQAFREARREQFSGAERSLPTRVIYVVTAVLFIAVPTLIAGIFGKRVQIIGLALSFTIAYSAAAGIVYDSLERQQRGKEAEFRMIDAKGPAPMSRGDMASWARIGTFVTLFGETGLGTEDYTISQLISLCARDLPTPSTAFIGIFALGGTLSVLGPLAVRYGWRERPFERRRWAYAAGFTWLASGTLVLHTLGSTSAPHVALVLGSLLLLVLMLPNHRAPLLQTSAQPPSPPLTPTTAPSFTNDKLTRSRDDILALQVSNTSQPALRPRSIEGGWKETRLIDLWPFSFMKARRPQRQTRHHYEMAHHALRVFATSEPYQLLDLAADEGWDDFIEHIYKVVCECCLPEGAPAFKPQDIRVSRELVGRYPAVLITMPRAHFVTEALMICVVVCAPMSELDKRQYRPTVRYFTLEVADAILAGEDSTMICEWDGEEHLNYGEGPKATRAAFLERVATLLD